jgi:hypothetical protein
MVVTSLLQSFASFCLHFIFRIIQSFVKYYKTLYTKMYLKMKWKCITLFIIVHEALCLFCSLNITPVSFTHSKQTYFKKHYDFKLMSFNMNLVYMPLRNKKPSKIVFLDLWPDIKRWPVQVWHYCAHEKAWKVKIKVKVKLSLCFFFNWAPCHVDVLGEWMYGPTHSWPWY